MVNKTCGKCNREYQLDDAEHAWLRVSGEVYHCPYCGERWYDDGGSYARARGEFVRMHRDESRLRELRYQQVLKIETLARRCAALKGMIRKLKQETTNV